MSSRLSFGEFKKALEDPNLKNGLMTKVWGPSGWLFLHCVTFGYPLNPEQFDKDNKQKRGTTRRHYKNFLMELGWVFPCKYCRISYRKFIKYIPIGSVERALKNLSLQAIKNKNFGTYRRELLEFCTKCFRGGGRSHPSFLDSRELLCYWLYLIHNLVNDKLGVPECDRPSFFSVQRKYEQFRAKCSPTTPAERLKNYQSGCVIPANGRKKRCLIKIVDA
tara:strand:+ start:178 stop:837 length:660 start_codon:yes stop_codon:yes gene_type:complete